MLREETMLCFGTVTEPSRFSTSMQSTPRSPSSQASPNPTGPPPTMSTDVVALLMLWFANLSACRPRESGDPVITDRADVLQQDNKCSGILGPRFRGDDSVVRGFFIARQVER